MGPLGASRDLDGTDALHRGVAKVLHTPSFLSIAYTHDYDAELAVTALKDRGYSTVGFVAKGALPYAFVARHEGALAGVAFVDATELVDRIKAIKSPEE